ncbi:glycosyltransferase family 39 protein [Pseudonocardia endophytica]|uniref:Dolichyl-phosphate-mannose-protein mannosyltransferase n=1 Tax=Pseudonocardia endophytica TaxID=401976 RepID=A0A4R1HYW5_PSEEN|nr:glycosyltransferase family 39 protein [Pseudonocardia endophytica]TCK25299.1 dolichyl-phosphate-mannose-protein mannosyltransferase [Pseudonocardia endophytica]
MQTVPTTREAASPSVPTFARAPVFVIAALTALAHLGFAIAGRGYWLDEVLMLAVGRHHLDWGSADQPPVVPLLAAAADAIAPGSMVALRVPAILATAAAVVVAALLARELGGDRRAQLITAGAQATAAWLSFSGHWLTPYALEPLQWLLIAWLLARWTNRRDDRLLLVLGVVVGIAIETKFQVLGLCAVLVLAVAVVGPRELFRRPALWAGAVVAALVAAPTMIWQAVHGWPQLGMATVAADEAQYLYGGRPGVAVLLVVIAGFPGTVLAVYGLVRFLRGPDLRPYRFLGVSALVLYVVFVVTEGRFYYLAGMLGVLIAAGAVGLQRRREARGAPRRVWPWFGIGIVVAAAALWVSGPSADPATPERFTQQAAEAYRSLPPEQREHTAVVGGSYIYASYLDAYSDEVGLPEAYSGNRSYGYFPPPSEDKDTVLYLGEQPESLRPWFSDVRPVGEPGANLSLATGRTAPWSVISEQWRTLTVS